MAVRRRLLILALALAGAAAPAARAQQTPPDAVAARAAAEAAFGELVAARALGAPGAADADRALATLTALPARSVRTVLALVATRGDGDETTRRAALDAYVRIGGAEDIALVLKLWQTGLEAEVEDCTYALLMRDPKSLARCEPLAQTCAVETRTLLFSAVERVGGTEGARWLGRCADRVVDGRGEAAARLGRMALSLREALPDEARSSVRALLYGSDLSGRREAIVAAGRMRDSDAVPLLIEVLDQDDPGARRDAGWALGQITGLGFGVQRRLWAQWYEEEMRWWNECSPHAFRALESRDAAVSIPALLDIACRRLWRDRLAREVAGVLTDPDPAVAAISAGVLEQLGSPVALPGLVTALTRRDPPVVQAAHKALRKITGKDFPPDAEAWRAALDG